jgi:CRISPR/Cas system-associated exonuclease Cas4 (RecB family)
VAEHRCELNPAQQHVNDTLRSPGLARPSFPSGLGQELREEIEHEVAPLTGSLTDRLFVSKFALASVHGCEARFLALDNLPFRMTAAVAAGTVAHKAIQYSQHWDEQADPYDLVEAVLQQLAADQDRVGEWFVGATPAARADLRTEAVDRVAKFLESFPPLQRSWRAVPECALRQELVEGRIVLSGRVDLVLGRTVGLVAGKAFIDFKTGSSYAAHTDDLRFYALLEAMRLGVPPFRLATYYLDQGRLSVEDVAEGMLRSTARRVIDGIVKLIELRGGSREPTHSTGPSCRHCPLLEACAPGLSFVAEADERSGLS